MKCIHLYLLLIVWSLVSSCGYTSTEDDKFPEMANFPGHSSTEISIKSLNMRIDTIYETRDGNLMAAVYFLPKEGDLKSYRGHAVALFTADLELLKFKKSSSEPTILENDAFFIKDDSYRVFRYAHFNSPGVLISKHPFNGALYKEGIVKELTAISLKKYPNDDPEAQYLKAQKIDRIAFERANDEFNSVVMKDIKCIYKLSEETVLSYKDQDFILNTIPNAIWRNEYEDDYVSTVDIYNYTPCARPEVLIANYECNLIMTDKAVTGNGSAGGNHFAFGSFYTKGYEYYSFEIAGKKTVFKNYDDYVGAGSIKSRKIPNKELYLLEARDWVTDIKPTYLAKIK